jgi:hypothetical protein
MPARARIDVLPCVALAGCTHYPSIPPLPSTAARAYMHDAACLSRIHPGVSSLKLWATQENPSNSTALSAAPLAMANFSTNGGMAERDETSTPVKRAQAVSISGGRRLASRHEPRSCRPARLRDAQRFLDGLQCEIAACNPAIAIVEKRCANPA